MDYHLIKASEARELAETRFRKYYSEIEKKAKLGDFTTDFTLTDKGEEDRRFYEELLEDLKSREYTIETHDEEKWQEDRWGDYIEGSDYIIHHVKVKW